MNIIMLGRRIIGVVVFERIMVYKHYLTKANLLEAQSLFNMLILTRYQPILIPADGFFLRP